MTITYTGEMWRLGTAKLDDRLFFSYNTLSTTFDDANNWNFASALDFQTPDASGVVDTKTDGNVAPNKKTISATVNISLPANSILWIRWVDSNSVGSDCALAVDDFTISFSASSVPCTEPASNPNAVLSSNISSTFYSITHNTVTASGYLVVNSTSASLSAQPVDGTNYTVGTALGGGTVVSNGNSTTFNVSNLNAGTKYYYYVFAYNNSGCINGPNYKLPAFTGDVTTKTANCVDPSASATNLIFTNVTNTQIQGSYTLPAPTSDSILVLYSVNSTVDFPMDSQYYAAGQTIGTGARLCTVLTKTKIGTTFSTSGLSAGTRYYFWVIPFNFCPTNGEQYYRGASVLRADTVTSGGVACTEPSSSATSMVFTNVTNNQIQGSYTLPSPASDSIIVLYSTNSFVDFPQDGKSYAVGQTIGTSTNQCKVLNKTKSGTTFNATGLLSGTRYFFWVIPYNFCSNLQDYKQTQVLRDDTVTSGTACGDPSEPITNLALNAVSSTTVNGTYSLASPASDSVIILISTNGFVDFPQDLNYYLVGQTIGTGSLQCTVLDKNRNETNFTATGLTPNTKYHFWAIPYNSCPNGPYYRLGGVMRDSIITPSTSPCIAPSAVSSINVTTTTSSSLSGNVTTNGATGYLIIISQGGFTGTITNGTSYSLGQTIGNATVLSNSSASFNASGLAPSTIYNIYCYAYNNSGCTGGPAYSPATLTNPTTSSGACVAPSAVSSISFTGVTSTTLSGGFVTGTATGYVVLLSQGAFTGTLSNGTNYTAGQTIGNGTVLQNGSSSVFSATGLTPSTNYFVTVFAFNNSGCTGGPAYSSATSNNTTTVNGACVSPTAVSSVNLSGITSSSLSGTITAGSASGYLYILSQGGFTGAIANGTIYTLGQTIGNGTVIQNNTSTSWIATGLSANTSYTISVYAYNNTSCTGGPAYATARSVTQTTALTNCVAPSANPSVITFSGVTSTNISGSFTANGSTGYVVMYSTSTANIPNPTNGTMYAVGNFAGYSVASVGAATTFNVTTSPNTRLYFKVFAYNNTACVNGPTYNNTATAFDTITLNSTGIKDIVKGPSFNVYPNPAMSGGNVQLQFQDFISGEVSLSIISLSGEVVDARMIYLKNQNALEINTSNLAKGMYQIVLQKDDALSSNKLIIQ
jgi:hypothetical protein